MLRGKHVFITGGSRGIGKAIVREAFDAAANITFTYNTNKLAAERLVTDLKAKERNIKISCIQCDTADYNAVRSAITDAVTKFGPIDILINNAGITRDSLLVSLAQEDWNQVIETNLTGTYNTTKAVIFEFLKRKSGAIINITSIAGIDGNAGQTNYAASKAGIIGFTSSLAKEVGPFGIRVNAIAPGFIDTDMSASVTSQKSDDILKRIPLRHIGTPEQVAKVTTFLASGAADYITGQVIRVDGGMTV